MDFKYTGDHQKIEFKRPGDRKKITLKQGEKVEIEDRLARAFVVSKQALRLKLEPASEDDRRKLASLMEAAEPALSKAVSVEDFAKAEAARKDLENELAEIKANVFKNGHKAADEEIKRLSEQLYNAREDAAREYSALHRKLEESQTAQAKLSEQLAEARAVNAAFEARLTALEKPKGK